MRITEAAQRYCESRQVARTVIYSANSFASLCGDYDVSVISESMLIEFVTRARRARLSESSIKGKLKDLKTVIKHSGRDVRSPTITASQRDLSPVQNDVIDSIWKHLQPWARQHVAVTWYCGARLSDVIQMQIDGMLPKDSVIRWTASKTKIKHVVPTAEWMRPWMQDVPKPFSVNNDWTQVIVREELKRACSLAKVEAIQPREIRQAGYDAWTQAGGWSGKVLHDGKIDGTMRHYVSPMSVLKPAVARLKVPVSMQGDGKAKASSETELLDAFRSMDENAKSLLLGMSSRLAVG